MQTSLDLRRKRYVRTPSGSVVLTSRDISILTDLYENRFLHTGHLQALYGERTAERLTLLYNHGYVDRPRAARVWRQREGGGSKPMVYALAFRGAAVLGELGITRNDTRDWTERNRDLSLSSLMIPHELLLADVRIAFRRAVSLRPQLRLLEADELSEDGNVRAIRVPGRPRAVYPDWLFGIAPEGADTAVFAVEVDRGTEPNTRASCLELQSLGRKFEHYQTYADARLPFAEFSTKRFRVLTVITGGAAKARNVAATALQSAGARGADRFLVASADALTEGDPLSLPWLNAEGRVTLLDI